MKNKEIPGESTFSNASSILGNPNKVARVLSDAEEIYVRAIEMFGALHVVIVYAYLNSLEINFTYFPSLYTHYKQVMLHFLVGEFLSSESLDGEGMCDIIYHKSFQNLSHKLDAISKIVRESKEQFGEQTHDDLVTTLESDIFPDYELLYGQLSEKDCKDKVCVHIERYAHGVEDGDKTNNQLPKQSSILKKISRAIGSMLS